MAVLTKDEFFNRVNEIVGTDTSDTSLAFIEDMGDTFNDLESRINTNGEDWEKKYHELDESWKKKYKSRFFSSSGGKSPAFEDDKDDDTEPINHDITIDDLFEKKGR